MSLFTANLTEKCLPLYVYVCVCVCMCVCVGVEEQRGGAGGLPVNLYSIVIALL